MSHHLSYAVLFPFSFGLYSLMYFSIFKSIPIFLTFITGLIMILRHEIIGIVFDITPTTKFVCFLPPNSQSLRHRLIFFKWESSCVSVLYIPHISKTTWQFSLNSLPTSLSIITTSSIHFVPKNTKPSLSLPNSIEKDC